MFLVYPSHVFVIQINKTFFAERFLLKVKFSKHNGVTVCRNLILYRKYVNMIQFTNSVSLFHRAVFRSIRLQHCVSLIATSTLNQSSLESQRKKIASNVIYHFLKLQMSVVCTKEF